MIAPRWSWLVVLLASITFGQWVQQGSKLLATPALAYTGYSVSLTDTGTYLLVGSPYLNNGRGAAWVFVNNTANHSWDLVNFQLIGSDPGGLFGYEGYSVDFSSDGSTLVSGAPYDGLQNGAAWVFAKDTSKDNTWVQQGPKLIGKDPNGQTPFQGCSVSISSDGNTIASGGSGDNDNAGAVWIFTRTGTTWSQQGNKLEVSAESADGNFGSTVALSGDGNTIAIGGPADNGYLGGVWIFVRNNGTWSQQGSKLVGSNAIAPSHQGYSLAISADGNTVIIGGPGDNNFTGAAWIFTRSDGTWAEQAKLAPDGAASGSAFATSVSVSGDGKTAAIGARDDNKFNGATYVYVRQSDNSWVPDGNKLVGTGNVGVAEQGIGVAISADGNLVATGGYHDNDFVGAVWVLM